MMTYRFRTEHVPVRVLVHHADAGPPRESAILDEWRGLTPRGHAQAAELAFRLGHLPVRRLLSSPSLRCRQTFLALARHVGLGVESSRLLAADVDPERLARFLREDETRDAILCTHRDTLLGLFGHLARSGSRLLKGLAQEQAAGAWLLHGGPDGLSRVRYLGAAQMPGASTVLTSEPPVAAVARASA